MTVAPVETLDVSVLVPAKDEADNLPEFVQRCAEALGAGRLFLRGHRGQRRLARRQ